MLEDLKLVSSGSSYAPSSAPMPSDSPTAATEPPLMIRIPALTTLHPPATPKSPEAAPPHPKTPLFLPSDSPAMSSRALSPIRTLSLSVPPTPVPVRAHVVPPPTPAPVSAYAISPPTPAPVSTHVVSPPTHTLGSTHAISPTPVDVDSPITSAAVPMALPTITISHESHSTSAPSTSAHASCWPCDGAHVTIQDNNVTDRLASLERRMDQLEDWMSQVDEWRHKDEEWKRCLIATLKTAGHM
jgi:hypothetical protein